MAVPGPAGFVPDHVIAVVGAEKAGMALGVLGPPKVFLAKHCSPLSDAEGDSLGVGGGGEAGGGGGGGVEEAAKLWGLEVDRSGSTWRLVMQGFEGALERAAWGMVERDGLEEGKGDGVRGILLHRCLPEVKVVLAGSGWSVSGDGGVNGSRVTLWSAFGEEEKAAVVRREATKEMQVQWARLRGAMGGIVPRVRRVIKLRLERMYEKAVEENTSAGGVVDWAAAADLFVVLVNPSASRRSTSLSHFHVFGEGNKIGQREKATRLALGFDPSDTTPLTDGEVLRRWRGRSGLLLLTGIRNYMIKRHFPPKPNDAVVDDWLGVDFSACMYVLQQLRGVVGGGVDLETVALKCNKEVRNTVMHDKAFLEDADVDVVTTLLAELIHRVANAIGALPEDERGDELTKSQRSLIRLLNTTPTPPTLRLPEASMIDPRTGLAYAFSEERFKKAKHHRLEHVWRRQPWAVGEAPPGRWGEVEEGVEKVRGGEGWVLSGVGGVGKSTLAEHVAQRAMAEGVVRHVVWVNAESETAAQGSFKTLAEQIVGWADWPVGGASGCVNELLRALEAHESSPSLRRTGSGSGTDSETDSDVDPWRCAVAVGHALSHLPGVVLVVLDILDAHESGVWLEEDAARIPYLRFLRTLSSRPSSDAHVVHLVTTRMAVEKIVGMVEDVGGGREVDEVEEEGDRLKALGLHAGVGEGEWEGVELEAAKKIVSEEMMGGWVLGLELAGMAVKRSSCVEYVAGFDGLGVGEEEAVRVWKMAVEKEVVDACREVDDGVDEEMVVGMVRRMQWRVGKLVRLREEDVEDWGVDEGEVVEAVKERLGRVGVKSRLRRLRKEAKSGRKREEAAVDLSLQAVPREQRGGVEVMLEMLGVLKAGVRVREEYWREVEEVGRDWGEGGSVRVFADHAEEESDRRVLVGWGLEGDGELEEVKERCGLPCPDWLEGLMGQEGGVDWAMRRLVEVGLVRRVEGGVVLHRVVGEIVGRKAVERRDGVWWSVVRVCVLWGLVGTGPDVEFPVAAMADGWPLHALSVLEKRKEGMRWSEGELCTVVGSVWRNGCHLDAAMGLFEESLRIQERVGGKETSGYATMLQSMGLVEKARGHLDAAMGLFEESLRIEERVGGKETEGYATTLHSMGLIEQIRGRLDAAMGLYEESLRISERLESKETEGYATTLQNMGVIEQDRGRLDAAMSLFEASLRIQERVGGKETLEYATTLQNVGGIEEARGRLDAAMSLFEASLRIHERVGGRETLGYAAILQNMGVIEQARGRLDVAMGMYEESLRIFERVGGKETSGYAITLRNMGGIEQTRGRLDAAMEDIRASWRQGDIGICCDAAKHGRNRAGPWSSGCGDGSV